MGYFREVKSASRGADSQKREGKRAVRSGMKKWRETRRKIKPLRSGHYSMAEADGRTANRVELLPERHLQSAEGWKINIKRGKTFSSGAGKLKRGSNREKDHNKLRWMRNRDRRTNDLMKFTLAQLLWRPGPGGNFTLTTSWMWNTLISEKEIR